MIFRPSTIRFKLLCTSLTYLLITIDVTGCRRASPNPGSGTPLPPGALIAVIGPSQAYPNWPGIQGGAELYGRRPYLNCLTRAPETDQPEDLLEVVEEVIKRGVLAVCLCVDKPKIALPAAQRIAETGILLVTVGQPLEDVNTFGHVSVDFGSGAALLGEKLDSIAAGRLSYVLVHEKGRNRDASLRYNRFMSMAHSRSTLRLLEQRNAAESDRSQQELIEELRQRFTHVGLIVTLNPDPWLSLEPRNQLPTDNRFATLAAPPRLWPRLIAGEAAALVGPLDGEIGFSAVEMAVTGLMNIPDAPRLKIIQCHLVTPDNLGDFVKQYAEAAGLDLADLLPFGLASQPASPGVNADSP
ncbi:MAG: substrate-binding domain-containing protein [Planctomycetota bacterium]